MGSDPTPEQYEMQFGHQTSAEGYGEGQPPPPATHPWKADTRPWWRKKRFALPIVFVGGGFTFLVGLGLLLAAFGVTPEESSTFASESDSAAETDEPVETTEQTVAEEPTTTTTTSALTTTQREPAAPTFSVLERPVSDEEIAIAIDALDSATVLDDLGAPVPYRRDDYADGWGDADGDCFSDRHEILLERSEAPTELDDCQVATGQWTDPYDGEVYTDARTITIDHFVPLSAAHRAGAWAWDSDTKAAFAADIVYRQSHVPAGQATNEEKGDKEPDQWRPEIAASWCAYAIDWVSVKTRWQLDFSTTEVIAIRDMLDTCVPTDEAPPATTIPIASLTTSVPPPEVVEEPIVPNEGAASVEISWCRAREETVQLVNTGGELITLTGWVLHDERRNHETRLDQISLAPGQRVVMLSGDTTLDVPETFRWTGNNVWNNDGDTATLLDDAGVVVSEERCSS